MGTRTQLATFAPSLCIVTTMESHQLELVRQVMLAFGLETGTFNGKGTLPIIPADGFLVSSIKLPNLQTVQTFQVKYTENEDWFYLYPSDTSKPLFLQQPDIHPSPVVKLALGTRMAFSLGLGSKQADDKIYVYGPKPPFLQWLHEWQCKDWVLHLRSTGRSGMAVSFAGNETEIKWRIKIAFNEAGSQLLRHEAALLPAWSDALSGTTTLPNMAKVFPAMGGRATSMVPHLRPKKYQITEEFDKPHFEFLEGMYHQSVQRGPLRLAPFWKSIGETVKSLGGWLNHHAADPYCQELPNGLALYQMLALSDQLIYLWQALDDMPEVFIAWAHNNFSPQKCYLVEGRLHVHDFELAHEGLPVLTDLFQFYFQPSLLLQPDGPKLIKAAIDATLAKPEAQKIIKGLEIDASLYYLMFLLWHVATEAYRLSRTYRLDNQSQEWLVASQHTLQMEIDRFSR